MSLRCAIYTRKSSEEGLDQDFNSLHAQREACEAYIKSQRHEQWRALPDHYDDGGHSGGTLERPALKHLLEAVKARRVDVIVIYKIDRLTRSLTDFAKLADLFDKHGVSFVSVTQQFNTTTSMGRLMLNVLLSFAQFEREITGERIRDKIAASKKKGLWMGGTPPLGYGVKDRALVIHEEEAAIVRRIFALYLDCGNVTRLREALPEHGIRPIQRSHTQDRYDGLRHFSRGHLYKLLSNPLYAGRVRHKEETYPGQHQAIIDGMTWQKVQNRLAENLQGERTRRSYGSPDPFLLNGLLVNTQGKAFVVNYTQKGKRRYRYYVDGRAGNATGQTRRLPAQQVEQVVRSTLQEHLTSPLKLVALFGAEDAEHTCRIMNASATLKQELELGLSATWQEKVRPCLREVVIAQQTMQIRLASSILQEKLGLEPLSSKPTEELLRIDIPIDWRRRGEQLKLVANNSTADGASRYDPRLVKAVARAHHWFELLSTGKAESIEQIAKEEGMTGAYISRLMRLAFLSPELVEGILKGEQPVEASIDYFLNYA